MAIYSGNPPHSNFIYILFYIIIIIILFVINKVF